MIVNENVDADAERQHEDAGNLAEDPGRQRADRVVEPVDVASRRRPTQISAAISATKTGMAVTMMFNRLLRMILERLDYDAGK